MSKDAFNPTVIGLSALGNNVLNSSNEEREVPLVFDPITGTYCAKLSKVNQEERLHGLEVANLTTDDQTFLAKAGYQP